MPVTHCIAILYIFSAKRALSRHHFQRDWPIRSTSKWNVLSVSNLRGRAHKTLVVLESLSASSVGKTYTYIAVIDGLLQAHSHDVQTGELRQFPPGALLTRTSQEPALSGFKLATFEPTFNISCYCRDARGARAPLRSPRGRNLARQHASRQRRA